MSSFLPQQGKSHFNLILQKYTFFGAEDGLDPLYMYWPVSRDEVLGDQQEMLSLYFGLLLSCLSMLGPLNLTRSVH